MSPSWSLLLLALGLAPALAALTPQAITTRFATADQVIASLVVTAPRDGVTDASAAIQAAIDEAAAAGGAVVFLPAGRYRLERPLTLKQSVTLRGDFAPDAPDATAGTLLLPVHGRGSEDGAPAITMECGAGLREVGLWYPEQSARQPVPYPWCLRTSSARGADNWTVQNVTLYNPWLGFKTGPEGNELHTLRNVRGTPLKCGVWMDTTSDIGRLTELDFAPRWWSDADLPNAPRGESLTALAAFLKQDAIGVDCARSDWEYFYRVRVSGYGTGVRFRAGQHGTTNAVMFGCELTGCRRALEVGALNGVGVAAVGCRFEGEQAAVLTIPAFRSVFQFNACSFATSGANAVELVGDGTLTFANCHFDRWRESAVRAAAGTVALLGCDFAQAGRAIAFAEPVRRARVLGCRFTGAPDLANESKADIGISHSPLQLSRPDTSPHPAPPDPRPAGRTVRCVTDDGAATTAADNTAAFQQALDTVGAAGGGTVYVPAGKWPLRGGLTVPSGVELRGISDVPHHTVSGGTVLFAYAGRGQEDGPPLIQLRERSGVRGLTVWHPEQNLLAPVAYPWVVRGLGPRCWVIDLTVGNAWQGVDFGSQASAGHLVRYLAGSPLRRGLWVSRSDSDGWVEDVQFNPHYALRLPPGLPHPPYTGDVGGKLIEYQRGHLDGLVFGRCAKEHLRGTFLYAAYDGIAFRDDGGGSNARVLMHGSDTVSRSAYVAASGPAGIEFSLAQLVPLSHVAVGGIVIDPAFSGQVAFYNSQLWAGETTAQVAGSGRVTLQQLNSLTGPVRLIGGQVELAAAVFARGTPAPITVADGVRQARLVGNLTAGPLAIEQPAGTRCQSYGNSASGGAFALTAGLTPAQFQLASSFEPGEPRGPESTVSKGGGVRAVSKLVCRPVEGDAHTGRWALKLSGVSEDKSYSFGYATAFSGPFGVAEDTVLSYWLKPLDQLSEIAFVDVWFADGTVLRDTDTATVAGRHARGPGARAGTWTKVDIPLGRFAGRTIREIMLAWDTRGQSGPFAALLDDVSLSSIEALSPAPVSVDPAPGPLSVGGAVTLNSAAPICYTTDGSNPTPQSPRYTGPLRAPGAGAFEIRFAVVAPDGRLSQRVRSVLYDVK